MTVRTELADAIAWVTVDRQERRNAIDPETHELLTALWPELEADPAVRVIVLTGAGEHAFCSGADIGSFLPYLASRIAAGEDPGHFCGLTHRRLRKPLLAAINGAAVGGGLELALAADLRIAAATATFALPEVKIGAIAGAGGISRLLRTIPHAVAARMVLTGEPIDAHRALDVGLVSEVVPLNMLRSHVQRVAVSIARCSEQAITSSLEILRGADTLSLEASLIEERKAFRKITETDEFVLALQKFCAQRSVALQKEGNDRP